MKSDVDNFTKTLQDHVGEARETAARPTTTTAAKFQTATSSTLIPKS